MSAADYITKFYGAALGSSTFSAELHTLVLKHQMRVLRSEQRATRLQRHAA